MNRFLRIILMTSVLTLAAMTAFAASDRIDTLRGIGVIPDRMNAIGEITRYDFAKIVANLFAYDTHDYSQDELNYTDVAAGSEYVACVNKVSSYGVMLGTSNGVFGGEENITYEQAMVILVRVLGYEYPACEWGGYPDGYVNMASDIGLVRSIPDATSAEKICAMVYNALTVPMAEQVFSDGDILIRKNNKFTILSNYFGLYTEYGRLQSVGKVALSSEYSVSDNKAMIDGYIYDITNFDEKQMTDMIGRNVEIYCDDEHNIKYCAPTDTDSVLNLDFTDIQKVTVSSITYATNGGKTKTVSTDRAAYIVYNSRPLTSMPLLGRNGKLTLVENDGSYDVIIIKEYATKIVNEVYEDSILFDDGTVLSNTNDNSKYIFLFPNGKSAKKSIIHKNDTLSVGRSFGDDFTEVIVSSLVDYGRILSVSDGDYNSFSINVSGIDYKVSPEFYDKLKSDGKISTMIGFTGYFCIDKDGKIAKRTAEGDEYIMQIGYIIKVDEGGAFDNPRAYILSADGTRQKYDFKVYSKNTIRVNESLVTYDKFVDDNSDASGVFTRQVIAFKTNLDGEITDIQIASDERSDSLYKFAVGVSGIFRSNLNSFGSKVLLSSSPVVFLVPSNSDSFDDYTVGDLSVFKTSRSYKGLDFYSYSNDNLYANIVVYQYNVLGMDKTADAPFIIDKISKSLVDEYAVDSLKGYNIASYVKLNADAKFPSIRQITIAADLNRTILKSPVYADFGDLVRCSRSVTDDVSMLGIFYDYSEDACLCTNPMSETDNKMKLSLGTAVELDHNNILKLTLRDSSNVEYYDLTKAGVVVCSDEKLREGTLSDIVFSSDANASVVIVYSTYDEAKCIYIYNK